MNLFLGQVLESESILFGLFNIPIMGIRVSSTNTSLRPTSPNYVSRICSSCRCKIHNSVSQPGPLCCRYHDILGFRISEPPRPELCSSCPLCWCKCDVSRRYPPCTRLVVNPCRYRIFTCQKMWQCKRPFHRLIVMEPILLDRGVEQESIEVSKRNRKANLKRIERWPNLNEAVQYHTSKHPHKSWDPEVLDLFSVRATINWTPC